MSRLRRAHDRPRHPCACAQRRQERSRSRRAACARRHLPADRRHARDDPRDRRLHPEDRLDGRDDRLHDDGDRAQHGRRLRRAARPRVRRVLRCRRLHGGLVRLAAVRPGFDQPWRSGSPGRPAGNPHLDVARAACRRAADASRRHRDRSANPAAARRLPRDRDARLRRDHPAIRAQRRQRVRVRPHARHLRDQPDRLTRIRCHRRKTRAARELPAVVATLRVVLLGGRRDPPRDRVLQRPPT